MPATVPAERDLRLDLFRRIALWLIFLDHIPFNVVSWITIRNYGFSDAAEMFVFISGYTAGFVCARKITNRHSEQACGHGLDGCGAWLAQRRHAVASRREVRA
jgi:hypothetical protein